MALCCFGDAELNKAVEAGSLEGIKSKYQTLTQDTLEYLNQLKMYEELDAEMRAMESLEKDTQEEIHKLFIEQMKDKKIKVSKININRPEEVERLIAKTVEQLAKEGKADRLLEEADIDKVTKDFVKRLESALANNKLDRAYSLTALYEDFIEQLKTANPDITDEIVKAADFCLRKNTL